MVVVMDLCSWLWLGGYGIFYFYFSGFVVYYCCGGGGGDSW